MVLPPDKWEIRKKNELKLLKDAGFKVETRNNNETLILTINAEGWEPPSGFSKSPKKRYVHQIKIDLQREDYPMLSTEWLTPIYHPNIEPPSPIGEGHICIEMLKEKSLTNLTEFAKGLAVLVENPNVKSPLPHKVCQDAKQFISHTESLKTEDDIILIEIIKNGS